MAMRMISSGLAPAVGTDPLLTTGIDGIRDNNIFCSNTDSLGQPGRLARLISQEFLLNVSLIDCLK